MEFELPTAGIDVITAGVVPTATLVTNTALNEDFAVLNLSSGFSTNPNNVRFAFNFLGHVKFKGTSNDLRGFEFGFIQFMAHRSGTVVYLGQQSSAGHILVNYGQLIGTTPILDAFPQSKLPFFTAPDFIETGNEITTTMGDHPLFSLAQRLRNTTTGASNMLFRVSDVRRAVSIFSVRSPTKFIRHFAHVAWTLIYEFEFGVTNGDLFVRRNSSQFRADPVVLGSPGNNTLAGLAGPLAASRGPPLANDVAKAALAAFSPGNKGRQDLAGYPPGAPDDFVFKLQPVTIVP
jgi:hypothetical protein